MVRPRKCRRISSTPRVDCFKPRGVPLKELTEIYIPVEGVEAIRLADLEGFTMEKAAGFMGVSRHTFGRVLAEARKKIAEALVNGHALRIEGGDYIECPARSAVPPQQAEISPTGTMKRDPEEYKRMSKIAVSSEGPTLEDQVDPRFGRAAGFVVVDLETMATEYLDNGMSQSMSHGAGIQTAQMIAGAGAEAVLSGYVGPKAFQALAAAGVKVGQNVDGMTVGQAVERFKAGEVEFAEGPNRS